MAIDIDKFPADKIAQKMMRRVSPIYGRSYLAKWLYQVMGSEMSDTWRCAEEVRAQAFVDTATWGIPYWEHRYTIQPDETLSIEERRVRIKKKLRRRYPLNPARLENIILEIFGTETKVIENVAPYTFMVEVLDQNYFYFSEIVKEVKRIKPSHLTLLMLLQFHLSMTIHQRAECVQIVEARHCAYNLGSVRTTYWDGEFCLDGAIRLDGIYPDDLYREQLQQRAEITAFARSQQKVAVRQLGKSWSLVASRQTYKPRLYAVGTAFMEPRQSAAIKQRAEITQYAECGHKNDCRPTNLLDGSFCLDGSHQLDGMQHTQGLVGLRCTVTRITKNGEGVTEAV